MSQCLRVRVESHESRAVDDGEKLAFRMQGLSHAIRRSVLAPGLDVRHQRADGMYTTVLVFYRSLLRMHSLWH